MEIEDSETNHLESPFDFLELSDVQPHFADLNIELLRARHIQKDDYYSFKILSNHFEKVANYYRTLYQLELVRDRMDSEPYYYLQQPEEGKGKVSDQSRHRELSEESTVIGIMLLHMYYERYFTEPKEIRWEDILKEIMESDNRDLYKKMFLNDVRNEYTDQELDLVKKLFRKVIREFNILGWVKRLAADDDDEIHFVIRQSIHRLAKLYREELEWFEKFSETFSFKKD